MIDCDGAVPRVQDGRCGNYAVEGGELVGFELKIGWFSGLRFMVFVGIMHLMLFLGVL